MLLERGADPNKRYFFGAEINLANDIESLELLLNFGANTETRDRSGLTPLMRYARSSTGMEAVLLLLKYGADVNAMADGRNDFRTVLHYAILSGKKSFFFEPHDQHLNPCFYQQSNKIMAFNELFVFFSSSNAFVLRPINY